MKSIVIPIHPEFVAKILNGDKTIEIQKTAPKCDLPIDVYIYCTKSGVVVEKDCGLGFPEPINGKVVAKFTLRKVERFVQGLNEAEYEYLPNFALKDYDYYGLENLMEKACLNDEELAKYAPDESFYAWRISDLQIFDEPKELSEFYTLKCSQKKRPCNIKDVFDVEECHRICKLCKPLAQAPRSWQYVEKGE